MTINLQAEPAKAGNSLKAGLSPKFAYLADKADFTAALALAKSIWPA